MKKWKIGIDARSVHRPGSGVATYSRGLISALCNYEDSFDFTFVIESGAPIDDVKFPKGSEFYSTTVRKNSRLLRDFWQNTSLPDKLAKSGVHLYHGLDYDIPLVRTPFLKVSTMHDMISFSISGDNFLSTFRVRQLLKLIARSADLVITDSFHSKTDILRCLNTDPEKIKVVWSGIDDVFFGPPGVNPGYTPKKLFGRERYILYYGGFKKYKNVELLIKAFSSVVGREQVDLVLVGNLGPFANEIHKCIHELQLKERVVLFGFASMDELKYLLHNCELFVFPSTLEGFGLPVAEAIACGAPIVCSNAASLPEIGGDAVHYFEVSSDQSCAERMTEVLANRKLKAHLRDKAQERSHLFKWDRAVALLVSSYEQLLRYHFRSSNYLVPR